MSSDTVDGPNRPAPPNGPAQPEPLPRASDMGSDSSLTSHSTILEFHGHLKIPSKITAIDYDTLVHPKKLTPSMVDLLMT